jgi:hypothetical protein
MLEYDPHRRLTASEALESPLFRGKEVPQGSYFVEERSAPVKDKDSKIYSLFESWIKKVPCTPSTAMLAIDLFDRLGAVAPDIPKEEELAIAVTALNLAMKMNQRKYLTQQRFASLSERTEITLGYIWELEARFAQWLHFRLYYDNLALRDPGNPDRAWKSYWQAHQAGENTKDWEKLLPESEQSEAKG